MISSKLGSTDAGAELTERQRLILVALVDEHISTTRPVGSKILADRDELDVSSATIRNELAELGERGYLHQPHTSAGRVPSQKAYRFYVNNLATAQELSLNKLSWIHSQYRRIEPESDKILRLSTKLLADIVKHPAVALEPGSQQSSLVAIDAKPVSAHAVRIACTYSGGQHHEFVVRCEGTVTADQVNYLGHLMKEELKGSSEPGADGQAESQTGEQAVTDELLRAVRHQLWASGEGRVYVEGTAYVLEQPEFKELSRLQAVVRMLGQQQALRRLLSMASSEPEIMVVIGSEHTMPQLARCSTVMSGFSGPSNQRGILGVVGPMRMAYHEVISAVDCVAHQIGEILPGTDTHYL